MTALSTTSPVHKPTGRGLARSTVWSLLGQTLPLLVAVGTIPFLIRGLGDDRFGVLSLAWVVIGYFGLVDLGLGRAMTKVIAEKVGAARENEIPTVFWTTLALMLLLGCVGSVGGMILTPWLVNERLSIPAELRGETLHAFFLLALILPVDMTSSGLRGAMEAKGRFDLTSLIRVTVGSYAYASPMAVLFFTHSLVAVVAVLLLGRLAAWVVNFTLCLRVIPALREGPQLERGVLGPLLKMGGWMNVTGLVFPMMVTVDRFMIGSLVSVAAVAYYTTPYEMVTKLWVLPTAVAGVLFPTFSASFRPDRRHTAWLFAKGARYIFLGVFPVVLVIITFAHEGLTIWLGADFANHSSRILQILAIGVFVNSLSNVPFALIQGAGRPDLCAKLHLVELPVYVAAVYFTATHFGIVGVALIWTTRGIFDTLALFAIAQKLLRMKGSPVHPAVLVACGALLETAFVLLPAGPVVKMGFLAVGLVAFAGAGWSQVLDYGDRVLLLGYLDAVRTRLRLRPRRLRASSPHLR